MISKAKYVFPNTNITSLTIGDVYDWREIGLESVIEVKTDAGEYRKYQRSRFEFIEMEETATVTTAIYKDKFGLLFAVPSRNRQLEIDGCTYRSTVAIEVTV